MNLTRETESIVTCRLSLLYSNGCPAHFSRGLKLKRRKTSISSVALFGRILFHAGLFPNSCPSFAPRLTWTVRVFTLKPLRSFCDQIICSAFVRTGKSLRIIPTLGQGRKSVCCYTELIFLFQSRCYAFSNTWLLNMLSANSKQSYCCDADT